MFFKDDALLKTLDVFVILEGLPSLQCLLVISFCILSVFCLSTVTTYVILWYLPQKTYARVQKTFKKFDFLPWLVSQYLEMSSPSTFVKSNFFSLILILFFNLNNCIITIFHDINKYVPFKDKASMWWNFIATSCCKTCGHLGHLLASCPANICRQTRFLTYFTKSFLFSKFLLSKYFQQFVVCLAELVIRLGAARRRVFQIQDSQ